MYPSFDLLGKTFYTYPLMGVLGGLLAGTLAFRAAGTRGKREQDNMIILLLIASLGALLGGFALYGITNIRILIVYLPRMRSFGDVLSLLAAVFGGSVFYGGLLGGLGAGAVYLRLTRRSFAEYSDMAAPSIPLFHAFGRIGCFLGGCCYGRESAIGFTFRRSLVESANGVRRLPVQLIESAFGFLLCAALWRAYRRSAAPGKLLYIYLAAYGVFRFILEFWRGDEYRGFFLGLSTSQWISAAILAVVAVKYSFRRRAAQ
jgi:phosphatidylglycerol:prolipoprotein diacylglycerol transferase